MTCAAKNGNDSFDGTVGASGSRQKFARDGTRICFETPDARAGSSNLGSKTYHPAEKGSSRVVHQAHWFLN
jgi:hypothetical protein